MERSFRRAGVVFLLLGMPASASALSLSQVSTSQPHPGITLEQYRTSGPAADVWVARVDLCASGVSVEATGAPSSLSTAASFGSGAGLQLAINGDFYKTGPVRVYGRAVSEGVAWPAVQTGIDPSYSGEWFYERFGWIAVGHDRVDLTHTEWVKNNQSTASGWAPDEVAATPPPGTLALVSGFPELVVDGQPHTCSDPTDACFPDRGDMQARHPRSAMGLTQDRTTMLFVVVDGRTPQSSGMYGSELADLMGQLGAWEAFNLDGGGSSQMWIDGLGTVNDARGNNLGNGVRGVANHWGVRATGIGRPGHCPMQPPCDTIPAGGKTMEEEGDCFRTFGPGQYWREESAGHGGHLYWTNAWSTDRPSNWAWWQLHFEEAGTYEIEIYADPTFSVWNAARYLVLAGGQQTELLVDQGAASGWTSLGEFDFAAGGDQFVAVYDDASGTVPADQHIVADALRVTRLGPWCGDGTCGPEEGCESCPADCPPVDEIPNNAEDDDCDGETDEPADVPDASTSTGTDAGEADAGVEGDGGRPADGGPPLADGGPGATGEGEDGGCRCVTDRAGLGFARPIFLLLVFLLLVRPARLRSSERRRASEGRSHRPSPG